MSCQINVMLKYEISRKEDVENMVCRGKILSTKSAIGETFCQGYGVSKMNWQVTNFRGIIPESLPLALVKAKGPEQLKPVWQVPSGEVAELLTVLGKRILAVTNRKTGWARASIAKGAHQPGRQSRTGGKGYVL
ncbi:hypothetical protein C2G38_2195240 [Gigaspora rosea]|uniref:Uncharacterized protein n=1 Tax=Gigaspora rosea TaxID=44941 RepID=A0A397V047_9GLOM|nr:hypothetical protein C2G38_2195240 [Gigaspora rosea]